MWYHPAAGGWLRGLAAAGETRIGTLQLPAGPRIVWYWPTILVLAGDVAALALAVVALLGTRRRLRQRTLADTDKSESGRMRR
jgi:hypothetical protein